MAADICSAINQVLANNPISLYGPVADTMTQKNPWMTVFKSGTLPANIAVQLVSTAMSLADMGVNMGAPSMDTWASTVGSCNAVTMTSGSNSFAYSPQIKQFLSTQITLQGGFNAIESALFATVKTYANGIADFISADNQNQAFIQSGVKVVAQSNVALQTMITGGFNQYQVAIPTTAATAGLDWNLVNALARYQREFNQVTPFPDGQLRLIAGYDALESLRTQLGGASALTTPNQIPLGLLAAGNNKMAQDALVSYAMEVTLRGINFIKNPRPMRFNIIGGVYVAVNPIKSYTSTYGTGAIPNPDWNNAAYEMAALIGDDSFERLMPAAYSGEDKVKFGKQFFMGDIQFLTQNIPGNEFFNMGKLGSQVARAMKPNHPWHVACIIFKRCLDPQLTGCTGISALG